MKQSFQESHIEQLEIIWIAVHEEIHIISIKSINTIFFQKGDELNFNDLSVTLSLRFLKFWIKQKQ